MDIADTAQIEIERATKHALSNLKQKEVIESEYCVDCGAHIPEARRKATKTNLCIGCAEVRELQSKRFVTR